MPTKILDVDLAGGTRDLDAHGPYDEALVLVRWRGRPLGQLRLPVGSGRVTGTALREAATSTLGTVIAAARVADALARLDERPVPPPPLTATVVVCTRDRPEDLSA